MAALIKVYLIKVYLIKVQLAPLVCRATEESKDVSQTYRGRHFIT
jgi:hypothetical protein